MSNGSRPYRPLEARIHRGGITRDSDDVQSDKDQPSGGASSQLGIEDGQSQSQQLGGASLSRSAGGSSASEEDDRQGGEGNGHVQHFEGDTSFGLVEKRSVVEVSKFATETADGTNNQTHAFEQALKECAELSKQHGCVLVVPEGRWLTQPLRLPSRCTLRLLPGSVLVAPQVEDSWPTLPWMTHPLPPSTGPKETFVGFVYTPPGTVGVIIEGGGTIDGGGGHWWHQKHSAHKVPHLVHLVGSKNVVVRDVTLINSPSWTVHPHMSEDVTVERIKIQNPPKDDHGTNGVVFDSCVRCVLRDSVVETGYKEDAVAVKSGEDEHGLLANRPSRDILVERVTIKCGHAISVGSEMSGGVFNVTFRGITFDGHHGKEGAAGSLRIKSARGRGGVVSGIVFENIRGHDALYGIEFYMYYSKDENRPPTNNATTTPVVKDIVVRDVQLKGIHREGFIIAGLPESPFANLVFENVHLSGIDGDNWKCNKFKQCSYPGDGCATVASIVNVSPPPPKNCLLSAPPEGTNLSPAWVQAVQHG